ncbi:cytochrome P450 [Streptomyces sp. NPDC020141]|uniref:cytochrome P450 n=1 Tax=Streptomyces sp. NPDC020141 TaxID=3365065 RepID=UPI0037BA04AE
MRDDQRDDQRDAGRDDLAKPPAPGTTPFDPGTPPEPAGPLAPATALDPATLFDLTSPEYLASPYDAYRVARRRAPVCPMTPDGPWVVTGRAETTAVLADPERFTSRANTRGAYGFSAECEELLAGSVYHRVALFNADPGPHGPFRALLDEEFSPRALRRREPAVRASARALVQELRESRESQEPQGAQGRDGVDLLSRFAYPLPLAVLCDVIGIPPGDRDTVKAWNGDWLLMQVLPLPPEDQLRCARGVLAFEAYVRGLLAERGRRPSGDLLGVLAAAAAQSDPVCTDDDAVLALMLLLAAGHETTTHLIANTVHQLLRDRSRWERVVADPGLIPAAVEEGLRFTSSLQGVTRTAVEDATVGGVRVPAGAKVHAMVAAAGRDPGAAEDPETFRLDRTAPVRHLAFGHGDHACLGAGLARLESRIALETLVSELPELRLAPGFAPRHLPGGLVLHGLLSLPVTWSGR